MKKKFERELAHVVSIAQCYRAQRLAKKLIVADMKEQCKRLYDYAATIQKLMPGSIVKLKIELT